MIYFKFPFDEKIYSVNENSDKKAIEFTSFNQEETIDFKGNIEEIQLDIFNDLNITSQDLPLQTNHFLGESNDEYIDKLNDTIAIIKKNNLPKIVLSRRKIIDQFINLDIKNSFIQLCEKYPNAFRYFFIKDNISWMGAFSEILGKFNKKTNLFETMSLAGTISVDENWTSKEIDEQKPVSIYIQNILAKFASKVEESETYDHISGNIKHLRTDFKAKINFEDLDTIIQELHPTPAVCGIPKDFCKETIDKIEKYPRELYAGYIKIETEDFIYYFVNLRCSKIYKNSVHIFVGGGVTAQSNPEKEWLETELKSDAILKNLVFS